MAYVYWVHLPQHSIQEGYIGITSKSKVQHRWDQHINTAKRGEGFILHNAINKYKENLIYEVIYEGTEEACLQLEEYFRPDPNIGWNINIGGQLGRTGVPASEETRKLIGKASSLRMQGENNIMFNKTHTDETKAKISKTHKGRKHSEETRANMSKAQKGKTLSEDHKKKIGKAHKNKVVSEESKKKMSEASKGKTVKLINVYKYDTNELIASNTYAKKFAEEYNVCSTNISATARGVRKQHKGYYARYAKDN